MAKGEPKVLHSRNEIYQTFVAHEGPELHLVYDVHNSASQHERGMLKNSCVSLVLDFPRNQHDDGGSNFVREARMQTNGRLARLRIMEGCL